MSNSLRAPVPVPVEYPYSDGQPIGETPIHRDCIVHTIRAFQEVFAERPDVYVGGDMFVYYEEGNPRASVVPNVFVVFGAVKDELREGGWRETYKLWEEPKGPDFVLEVTSRSTQREDQVRKRALYARLGVTECFLYDPKGEYPPPLQGCVCAVVDTSGRRRCDCRTGGRGYGAKCSACTCAAKDRRCGCTSRRPDGICVRPVRKPRPGELPRRGSPRRQQPGELPRRGSPRRRQPGEKKPRPGRLPRRGPPRKPRPGELPRRGSPNWKRSCPREGPLRYRRRSDGPENSVPHERFDCDAPIRVRTITGDIRAAFQEHTALSGMVEQMRTVRNDRYNGVAPRSPAHPSLLPARGGSRLRYPQRRPRPRRLRHRAPALGSHREGH